MKIEDVTFGYLLTFVALGYLALQIYNTYCAARKNRRDEEQRRAMPTTSIEAMLASDNRRIEALEENVRDLEANQKDTHAGTMVICEGVQALLEHALHNGNSTEMDAASKSINRWLRNR